MKKKFFIFYFVYYSLEFYFEEEIVGDKEGSGGKDGIVMFYGFIIVRGFGNIVYMYVLFF